MAEKVKIFLILFFILQCFLEPYAQENVNLQYSTVKFSNTKLTLKEALDELGKLPEIRITYSSSEDFLKFGILLSSRSMNVQKALDEIRQQTPIDIVINDGNFEIKRKPLDDFYLIQGTVRDSDTKEVLVAAEIFIEGTTTGMATDNNGYFSMHLKPGSYILVVSYMGFHEKRIPLNLYQKRDLEIFLEVKQHEITEVSIEGKFKEAHPLEIGRSIDNIGVKIMSSLNTNDVNDALHGRLPGVWTTKVSGAPGDHNRIRIRGINSIFGSTDPLYVVDGMIIPIVNSRSLGISDLNTHDVNSISVLKDASSTALYGYLGGNGVILIETKNGGGKTQFNVNVKKGIQKFSKRYNLMDSETFLSTLDSSDKYLKTDYYYYNPKQQIFPKYPYYLDSLGNPIGSDDYQSELFRLGEVEEYQFSVQGSVKNTDYYISGNYYNHNGIIKNSNYNKYTLTGSFSKNITKKISIRFLYKGSHQENKNNLDNYLGNNVIFKGINFEPAYRYTPDSTLGQNRRLYYNPTYPNTFSNDILSSFWITPDDLFNSQVKNKNENSNSGNLVGNYKINNDFSAHASLSLSVRNINYLSNMPYQPPQYLSSKEGANILDQQYYLKFKKQFKTHGIDAFIRYRKHKDKTYWNIDSVNNIMVDGWPSPYNIYLRGSQAIYGEEGSAVRSISSFIFNANYNYKKKYFISVITNFDHLNEGHYVDRKDLFPSFVINWDLAKEHILHVPAWINAFNLYINWGKVGNYPLNSLSNDLYSANSKYAANNLVVKGVSISNLANHYLTSEIITETDYGTRVSLLRERIMLSAVYYVKKNSDLLLHREIPSYYMGGIFFDNIGEMENSGIELSLEMIPISTKVVYWSTQASFSKNIQFITKLKDGEPIKFTSPDVLYPDFIINENEILGNITGYIYHSKWNELSESEAKSEKFFKQFGMAYLKIDTLNKKALNENDKTIIGNSMPDFTFNWINSLEIKNFSCEMLWYGVIGTDKYNATKASTFITGTNTEVRNLVLDKNSANRNNIFYESSYFIEDASFIRLKTLSFTYSPTKKIASKISIKFSLSFENLVTLTRYSGYDPEATIYTENNLTDNAIDMGSYPNPQSTYLSIGLTF